MAIVTLLCPKSYEQDGNCYKGKTAQSSTNESDSLHSTLVILQTYAFSSTVSTMSQEQKSFCAIKWIQKIIWPNSYHKAQRNCPQMKVNTIKIAAITGKKIKWVDNTLFSLVFLGKLFCIWNGRVKNGALYFDTQRAYLISNTRPMPFPSISSFPVRKGVKNEIKKSLVRSSFWFTTRLSYFA